MQVTSINYVSASPYISRANIAQQFTMSMPSVDNRIREIKKEVEAGRYSDLSVIKDGGFVFVNYLVFIDYLANRQKLLEKNLRKHVEPFEPKKIANQIGWYNF